MGTDLSKLTKTTRKSGRLNIYAALTIIWSIIIVVAFSGVVRYSTIAGVLADPPDRIDVGDSRIKAHFFVHPKCPCTAASVEILDRVLTRSGITKPNAVTAHIFQPANANNTWARTSLTQRLERIPAIRCVADPDGREAHAFDITTSGHLLIYDKGDLLFSGGITASRGHDGECDASVAATAAFAGCQVRKAWPVYGCAIQHAACGLGCETHK